MSKAEYEIVEYLRDGRSMFARWFNGLDATAAAKVTTALYRLEAGNFSNVKSVGMGVMEYRINSVRVTEYISVVKAAN